jgi:hypothetical protein
MRIGAYFPWFVDAKCDSDVVAATGAAAANRPVLGGLRS